MDLHSTEAPLSHPDVPSGGRYPSLSESSYGSALHSVKPNGTKSVPIDLDITPIVRDHLFKVFFEFIQPAWPVVSKESLVRYPCNPVLEAAILGVAARHHTAIVSWRDLSHIQEVIDGELRNLFNLRDHCEHSIQTLQALLLLCLRVELCAKNHHDLQRLPFRISFACQIAQDLGCHIPTTQSPADEWDDKDLRRTLWAACIFVDTHCSAILGQEMNISMSQNREFCLGQAAGATEPQLDLIRTFEHHRFFYTAVGFMVCLRSVLCMGYSFLPKIEEEMHDQLNAILKDIEWHQEYLNSNKSQYSDHEWQCLQMIHSNTHLLFILSLRSTKLTDDKLRNIASTQLFSVMTQACQTLEWSTSELIESAPGQLLVTLYSTSRALMVIVDVLRDPESKGGLSTSTLERLQGAVENARKFMAFLSVDKTWGQKWTQSHTLKAIFTRLDQKQRDRSSLPHTMDDASVRVCERPLSDAVANLESTASVRTESRVQSSLSGRDVDATANEAELEKPPFDEDIWNDLENSMDLSNVILNPAEWESFFEQCDRDMYGPSRL
ncbi:hypothetical protein N7462_004383 [Penicillium macrosclerotiorum]|uniref:uncharacterized protein n=1 Tax=Penicillium macrosclerotiorum TaxID=303699 RepID=UPI0025473A82|nr:uncharacterized protein N7462_004383 [Penicillium macrosclerotiorum]KAJ5689991.1 hypothetical protein N7462_004383 [Penicillium macrosclerotiorum]